MQEKIKAQNPEAIDAVFLSNHDNGRSAAYLANDIEKQKMAASLYLMVPGNSFIYYGEEIGMLGSGIDENKRLPFVWSFRDKEGITLPPPNADYKVEIEQGVMEQEKDKNSLLNFYKEAIKIKNQNPEIARGTLKPIKLGNSTICAYECMYDEQLVYVIHNLSKEELKRDFSKEEYSYTELSGYLSTNGEEVQLKDNILILPPMSTAVIR